jgi:Hemerythrin HHE cation binding domain
MTTQKLPGTDAARHGTGDADLTIMLAAHDAFRRDLTRLARAAGSANDPARRLSVAAGWELFKRELHLHHTAEDEIIWPALRGRLEFSQTALSVLDEMEAEHQRIDPLLAAVDAEFTGHDAAFTGHDAAFTGHDAEFTGHDAGRLADVIDALASTVTGHLGHEERDGLPLIGTALTAAEWRAVGRKIARKNGLADGSEMFAWMLDGADRQHAAATLAQLPPPLRLLYRTLWKPRFDRTPRWLRAAPVLAGNNDVTSMWL